MSFFYFKLINYHLSYHVFFYKFTETRGIVKYALYDDNKFFNIENIEGTNYLAAGI